MPTTALTPDQIAALRALLAEVDSDPAQDQAGAQLSENGIADEAGDASTLSKGKPMRRIHGPYQERKGWRVKVVDRVTGKSTNTMFPTEIEARSAINRLRRKAEREIGISIDGAMMTYEKHLTEKGNKPLSICSTMERLSLLSRVSAVVQPASSSGLLHFPIDPGACGPLSGANERTRSRRRKCL